MIHVYMTKKRFHIFIETAFIDDDQLCFEFFNLVSSSIYTFRFVTFKNKPTSRIPLLWIRSNISRYRKYLSFRIFFTFLGLLLSFKQKKKFCWIFRSTNHIRHRDLTFKRKPQKKKKKSLYTSSTPFSSWSRLNCGVRICVFVVNRLFSVFPFSYVMTSFLCSRCGNTHFNWSYSDFGFVSYPSDAYMIYMKPNS